MFQRVERVLAGMSDRIIAISPSQLTDLSSRFKIARPEKFACIPLGFELDQFKNCGEHLGELRAEFGLGAEVVLVGLIGRLVPIKNHRLLLEAIARLDVTAEVRFFIVGDGHIRRELEQKATDLGIADRVIFTGARYGHGADLCGPRYRGPDPRSMRERRVTLIEAMAAGQVDRDHGCRGDSRHPPQGLRSRGSQWRRGGIRGGPGEVHRRRGRSCGQRVNASQG